MIDGLKKCPLWLFFDKLNFSNSLHFNIMLTAMAYNNCVIYLIGTKF